MMVPSSAYWWHQGWTTEATLSHTSSTLSVTVLTLLSSPLSVAESWSVDVVEVWEFLESSESELLTVRRGESGLGRRVMQKDLVLMTRV